MMNRAITALCVCSFLALSTGCRRGDRQGSGEGSTIRINYPADERSLSPASDDVPKFLVFSPLVTYATAEAWHCGEPSPGLAERWQHSPDYRTWTIHLRRDAIWHDGVPVTARDIKFTLDLWLHPDVAHWGAGPLDSALVLDDHTLRLAYRTPTRQPLNGWDVFYPRHVLATLDPRSFSDWEFWTRPAGSGPYRYVRDVPRTMMEFEANPSYFLGKPRVERIVLKWGGSPLVELLSGNVDAAYVSTVEAMRLRSDDRFEVHYEPLPGGVVLYWNQRLPFFADARVRRALTQAIDRRELHQAIDLPDGLPITDGIHTPCQFERRELAPAWPYDPEEARRLLDEAGWRDRDVDGVRERGRLEFAFTLIAPGNWLQAPEAAVVIQERLRRLGIRTEVQVLEGLGTVGDRVSSGRFEAAIWILPPSWHRRLFGAESPLGYASRRAAELLDRAEITVDLGELDRIYRELAELFRADLPVTYLYPKVDAYAAHRRIGGLGAGDLFMRAGQLWVEEPEGK